MTLPSNRFSPLLNYELSKNKDNNDKNDSTNFECNSSRNSAIKAKSPNKRPQVVINQFPENQIDFARHRTVPGKKFYSNAVKTKYNRNIKTFNDSIPRGIKMRDFSKFVRKGKAKLNVFQMLLLHSCYIIWMLT